MNDNQNDDAVRASLSTGGLGVAFDSLLDELKNAETREEMLSIIDRADELFFAGKLVVPHNGWQDMTRIVGLKCV